MIVPCAPQIDYRRQPVQALLDAPQTLAVFGFGDTAPASDDPRYMQVALAPAVATDAVLECWQVDGAVQSGCDDTLRWSTGNGWMFIALDAIEHAPDGVAASTEQAYARLVDFLHSRGLWQVQRLWNYLGAINHGEHDNERYKAFCAGRARGMLGWFGDGYPAATAIGHRAGAGRLQVYCLASAVTGTRVENPRQMNAWRYPRQYGPTAPNFARAMLLPARDALALSGTAAIVGHASLHADDLDAQLAETLANLRVLLEAAGLDGALDQRAVLKVYVRHREHVAGVNAFLDAQIPHAQRLLLLGDICRRELLVEIDGWRYA